MNLLKVAHSPPTTIPPGASVLDAARAMVKNRVGAVVVMEEEKGTLLGIFTERDLMVKVVSQNLDAGRTAVEEVMTRDVLTVPVETSGSGIIKTMVQRHFRHVPVVDEKGKVVGILSLRDLLRKKVEDLDNELRAIVSYVTADGIGG